MLPSEALLARQGRGIKLLHGYMASLKQYIQQFTAHTCCPHARVIKHSQWLCFGVWIIAEAQAYRVHVLDPQSVNRAIKHHPFANRRGVTDCRSDEGGGQAILPFIGQQVVLPVQLTHGDTLGIERVHEHWLSVCIGRGRLMEVIHSTLQVITAPAGLHFLTPATLANP